MKINKKNPKHWLYLIIGGVNVVFAALIRNIFLFQNKENKIVFSGHTLNGNLLSFACFLKKNHKTCNYFATLDPKYYRELNKSKNTYAKPLNLLKFSDVLKIAQSNAVITDRNSGVLEIFNQFSNVPFIDVWHGIPYKGYVKRNFQYLDNYKEVWVSSPSLKKIYKEQFGVNHNKLRVTGYSRVDGFINNIYDKVSIREKYQISSRYKKIVLVAPTWQQDEKGRDIIPFGVSQNNFFSIMNEIGREKNTLFIFRAHLNVEEGVDEFFSLSNVRNMPYAKYPEVEEFLAISDMLVTDWSSMAFDFLVLKKPTIFLDVKPPFKNGFTIGPKYRFGEIVNSFEKYKKSINLYLDNPTLFEKRYNKEMEKTIKKIYGSTLDGCVNQRYYNNLETILRTTRR